MMITPIKQQDGNCCALACIESLSIDKQKHKTQQQIIDLFPIQCKKGQLDKDSKPMDGQVDPYGFFQIVIGLELASTFIVGAGKSFMTDHSNSLGDGIFLHTTNHHDGTPGGYHCWRLENIPEQGFVVVEPSRDCPYPYMQHPWDYLETRGCIVIVCVP